VLGQRQKWRNEREGIHRALASPAGRGFAGIVETPSLSPFSAVLLAGGKSSRMGRDKAGLIIDDQPLWSRQLATLQSTRPTELFISGKLSAPYADAGVPIIVDEPPSCGPLSGLAAALRFAQNELLLVLAIDLPAMNAEFLSGLHNTASAVGTGVVPRNAQFFEPLAAIYSRHCLPLAEECLRSGDHSLQRFVRLAVEQRHVVVHPLTSRELPFFKNLNYPADC
jgi:molybdopterin-guanine dinucleotide biosynthesis protein A